MVSSIWSYLRFWLAGLIALALIGPALAVAVAEDSASTPEAVFVDTTPPGMSNPGDIVLAAAGGPGAVGWFEVYATDDIDGSVGVSCAPASGSWFPLGQ